MSARVASRRRIAKAKIRQTPRWLSIDTALKSYYSSLHDFIRTQDTSYDTATPFSQMLGRAFHGCPVPRTWWRPVTRGKKGWR